MRFVKQRSDLHWVQVHCLKFFIGCEADTSPFLPQTSSALLGFLGS
jgi:hypothetical protein